MYVTPVPSLPPEPSGSISLRSPGASHEGPQAEVGVPQISSCLSPGVLLTALQPGTGLAIWRRSPRVGMHRAIQSALDVAPFCKAAGGSPRQATKELLRDMPLAMRPLGEDIARLGHLFATVTREPTLRFRLEHVADNACGKHHVDSVRLRLLCTYAGLGTEWIDPASLPCRMSVFHVGIFKGSKFPDLAPRILHRSPPVAHLPKNRRSRLLLCIDQPGVF